jgi:hypothetical protein
MLTANKSSSELTNKIKNQTLYANYLIQQQAVSQGCLGRISIEGGSAASKEALIWTDIKEGQAQTTLAEQSLILTNNQCPRAPTALVVSGGSGSMVFNYSDGTVGDGVSFQNDTNLAIGTDDFTVEWFQYWQTGASYPRPFSIGEYPNADFAVSYEDSIFYVWTPSTNANDAGVVPAKNTWVHIALVGNGTTIKVYVQGSLQATINETYDFTDTTTALTIGNETNGTTDAGAFTGRISNFRWVKGTQVYTGNFTVPTSPLTAISGTQLLLLAESSANVVKDSSPANRTPTNTGVTYTTEGPF